jgi:hypothetical protein
MYSIEGGKVVKKLVLILVIAIIPVMAFADFQIGVTAVYDNSIAAYEDSTVTDYLVYGLDTRAKIWIFHASASALYLQDSATILMPIDLGLSFNVWFMRFGMGIGPIFGYTAGGDGFSESDYWNMKIMGDINIGSLTLGVVGYYFADVGTYGMTAFSDAFSSMPLIGVSVLFKLF